MNSKNEIPLIAILRGIKPDEVLEHIAILADEGFNYIEIPLNSPEWEKSIPLAIENYGDKLKIGAGTVLNKSNVEKLAIMNAKIIVTPNINVSVITTALENKMEIFPGCATATEAFTAIDAGAVNLKIFPTAPFGVNYVKSLMSVIPKNIAIYAVGGITPNNLHEYLSIGCHGAGLGNDLYQIGQTPEKTREKAKAFISAYIAFKNQTN